MIPRGEGKLEVTSRVALLIAIGANPAPRLALLPTDSAPPLIVVPPYVFVPLRKRIPGPVLTRGAPPMGPEMLSVAPPATPKVVLLIKVSGAEMKWLPTWAMTSAP